MPSDRERLSDMLRAARRIRRFTAKADRGAFHEDEVLQSAVIFQFLIIAEAAKHLSEDLRETHDEIPWSEMARMRDRLVHGYFDVDLGIVWTTVTDDLPLLVDRLDALLNE